MLRHPQVSQCDNKPPSVRGGEKEGRMRRISLPSPPAPLPLNFSSPGAREGRPEGGRPAPEGRPEGGRPSRKGSIFQRLGPEQEHRKLSVVWSRSTPGDGMAPAS